LKTLDFGVTHNKENLYVFSFDSEPPAVEHEIGTEGEVLQDSPRLDAKMRRCNPQTSRLTMIHNHPQNFAPSPPDYELFIGYRAVENMVICGHNGNIYFVQKSKEVLMDSSKSLGLL
jgi:hypothetical protein